MQHKSIKRHIYLCQVLLQILLFLSMIYTCYFPICKLDNKAYLYGLWVVVTVLIMDFARKNIFKFNIFILIHLALVIAMINISYSESMKFSNFFVLCLMVLYSITIKNKYVQISTDENMPIPRGMTKEQVKKEALRAMKDQDNIPYLGAAAMCVGYILSRIEKVNVAGNVQIILFILFVVIQLVINNLKELNNVFSLNYTKKDFPADQILKVNKFSTITSSIIFLTVMFIIYCIPNHGVISVIRSIIRSIVKAIAFLFIFLLGRGKESTLPDVELQTVAETMEELPTDDWGYSDGLIGQSIFEGISAVVVLVVIIAILITVVKYVKNFNKDSKYGTDEVENIKKTEKREKQKLHINSDISTSNIGSKVRKYYKNYVLKKIGKQKNISCKTPEEITYEFINKDKIISENITGIYEKARYSKDEITKEDIIKIKNLLDNK